MFWTQTRGRHILAGLAVVFAGFAASPASADSSQEILVTEAKWTLQKLLSDERLGNLKEFLDVARAVYIVPSLYKGGFLLGAEGGKGVVLAKGADGRWSGPAFYTMAGGSIGLQIGGQVSEAVFTIMNDEALNAILQDKFKLGGDLSIAMGPIGAGIEAGTTTNFKKADVFAFSHAVGLFGGGSIEGSAIFKDDDDNQSYYGVAAAPEAILLEQRLTNAQADDLRELLP